MSGGVDSSVAAALLKEQGYDVIGVYILGWPGTAKWPCSWQQEEADARAVANKLGIPFQTLNLAREYETKVVKRFFEDYRAGLTPNPDILCNQEIKFKAVWQAIRQLEPDYIATGHYARLREIQNPKYPASRHFSNKVLKSKIKSYAIEKGRDINKDQSYFLWAVDRHMLQHILFPIGAMKKPAVRQLAAKLQLPTAQKKDSQGICFIGPLKVRQFLAEALKPKPGQAVLADGRVVGTHRGSELYTLGQRLGAGSVEWTGDVPPLFVIAKDRAANRLIVGQDSETYATVLHANQINWLVNPPSFPYHCYAKVRYRHPDVAVTLLAGPAPESLTVECAEPVRALTPGQSIVFYAGDQLLGGAVITAVPTADLLVEQLYAHHRPTVSPSSL